MYVIERESMGEWRKSRNGELEISTMTWDRYLPDRVIDAWGVIHCALSHRLPSQHYQWRWFFLFSTLKKETITTCHLVAFCIASCWCQHWHCNSSNVNKHPWSSDAEETMEYEEVTHCHRWHLINSYMWDWTFMNDSEVTGFTIAWASIQELEGQQRTTEEKIQKLTNLYNELSNKYENLEGSASEEAIRNWFISCVKRDILHTQISKITVISMQAIA